MDLDCLFSKAVLEEFPSHVIGRYNKAMALLVQPDFFAFGSIAHPLDRKALPPVPRQGCAAGEDAIRRNGPGTDSAGERMVFIASHAAEIMVVDHADQWDARSNQGFYRVQFGQFVQVNQFGPEVFQCAMDVPGSIRVWKGKAGGENLMPGSFAL